MPSYTGSGFLSLGGSCRAVSPSWRYVASGSLGLSGAVSSSFNFTFSKSSTWDVSKGVLRSYRVEGKCVPVNLIDSSCPAKSGLNGTAGRMQFMVNVQAYSLADLCGRLISRGIAGPIKKVQIWSLPAFKSDYPEDADPSQNTLTTVPFEDIPECFDFTFDQNLSTTIGFSSSVILTPHTDYSYAASGGLTIGGTSQSKSSRYSYAASGRLSLGGSSSASSPQYYFYTASGRLSLGGTVSAYSSDYGILSSTGGMSASVLDFEVHYGFVEADDLSASADLVVTDCCPDIDLPQTLFVKHELLRSDRLSKFLRSNGLTISPILSLTYSVLRNSWSTSLHYQGNAFNQNQKENWDIIFEFGCLSEDTTLGIAKDVWGFSMFIRSRNLSNNVLGSTRLIVEFSPTQVCDKNQSLKLDFDLNTKSKITTPSSIKAVVLTDSLGSFNGTSYLRNPSTNFEVSSSFPDLGAGMLDQSALLQSKLLSSL